MVGNKGNAGSGCRPSSESLSVWKPDMGMGLGSGFVRLRDFDIDLVLEVVLEPVAVADC